MAVEIGPPYGPLMSYEPSHPMRIGIGAPQLGPFADPALTAATARRAEAAGFDSLWVIDRLLIPVEPRSPYPATPDGSLPEVQRVALDPLVTLTVAAAATSTIRLGTDVLVAPWYPPVLLARSLATLDRASGGRLVVGLGLGWSLDEYEAVGAPMQGRGKRLEEIIDVLHSLWGPGAADIATSRERIAPAALGVRPLQDPRPPVLLATFNPDGLDRVARCADGWLPAGLPLDVTAAMWDQVRSLAASYGRDPDALQLVLRAEPKLSAQPLGAERPPFRGSRQQVLDDIERAREMGTSELILDMQAGAATASELLDIAIDLAGEHLDPEALARSA